MVVSARQRTRRGDAEMAVWHGVQRSNSTVIAMNRTAVVGMDDDDNDGDDNKNSTVVNNN